MGRAILLCAIQSHEPHVVYRVWCPGSRRDDWCVAHHAQHDCRCHLLRNVHRPCHRSHPVTGLLTTPVPGKGETWCSSICYCIHFSLDTFYSLAIKFDSIDFCLGLQLTIISIINEALGCFFHESINRLVYKRSVKNGHDNSTEPRGTSSNFLFCAANGSKPKHAQFTITYQWMFGSFCLINDLNDNWWSKPLLKNICSIWSSSLKMSMAPALLSANNTTMHCVPFYRHKSYSCCHIYQW